MANKSLNKRKMMKKILPVLVGSGIVFALYGSSASAAASDIGGHWAEKQILQWESKAWIQGYEDGTVKPNNTVTRAEFMAFVNRAFGFKETSAVTFKDANPSNWEYAEIGKAVKAGYIGGYEDGTIRAGNVISRQESATIMAKLLNASVSDADKIVGKFGDAKQFADWSKQAIAALAEKGIINGYEDGTYRPVASISRAEAIVMIDRALAAKPTAAPIVYDKAGTYGPASGSVTIDGDVIISAPAVTLRNTVITGNLLFAEGIGNGDAFLDGVTVKGATTVQGGGENSVHFKNTVLVTVTVNKKDGTVRIVAEGSTTVQEVTVKSSSKLEESGLTGSGFNDVTLGSELPKDSKVTLLGDFDEVDVQAKSIFVEVPDGSIGELNVAKDAGDSTITLSEEAKVLKLVLDAIIKMLGEGNVEHVTVNSGGKSSYFDKKPGTRDGEQQENIIIKGDTPTDSGRDTYIPPVNQAPTIAHAIANQAAAMGNGNVTVDASSTFTDSDADSLTLTAVSNDTSIVTVAVNNKQLVVTPVAVGTATIIVTANDGNGHTVNTTFTVTVSASDAFTFATILNAITPNIAEVYAADAAKVNLLGSLSVASSILLPAGVTLNVQDPSAVLTISNGSVFTVNGTIVGAGTLNVAAGGTLNLGVNGILSGTGAVVVAGTYSDTDNSSTVEIVGANANSVFHLAQGSSVTFTKGTGITYAISGDVTVANFTVIAGNTLLVNENATLTVTGALTNNGIVTNNGTMNGPGTLTVSASGTLNVGVSGILAGTGSVVVAGTYTDTDNSSAVEIVGSSANSVFQLGQGASVTFTKGTGIMYAISGNVTVANFNVIAGNTLLINQGATLTVTGTLASDGTITNQGTLVNNGLINGAGTMEVTASGTLNLGVDGILAGTGSVVIAGTYSDTDNSSTVEIVGNSANSVFRLGQGASVTFTKGTGITYAISGNVTVANFTVIAGNKLLVNENATLTVTGTLTNNGTVANNGTINGEGTMNVTASGALTLGVNGILAGTGSVVVAGTYTDTDNSSTVEIVGANANSVFRLSTGASVTFTKGTGITYAISGNVTIANFAVYSGNTLLINPNATLTVTGTLTSDGTITNQGTIINNGLMSGAGTMEVKSTGTLNLGVNGSLEGTGSVVVAGTYSDTDNSSTVEIVGPNANSVFRLGQGASVTFTKGTGITYAISGNVTVANFAVYLGNTLVINPNATLTVTGTLTSDGTITNNGTLINNGTINGSGTMTVTASGTLNLGVNGELAGTGSVVVSGTYTDTDNNGPVEIVGPNVNSVFRLSTGASVTFTKGTGITYAISGSVTIANFAVYLGNTLVINPNAILTVTGTLTSDGTITNNGTLINNGTINGSGTMTVTASGTLNLGVNGELAGTGAVVVAGTYKDTDNSGTVEIVGPNANSVFRLSTGASVTFTKGPGITYAISGSVTVVSFAVYSGNTLLVNTGATLTITGTLLNDGTVTNDGTINGIGNITGSGTINGSSVG